MSWAWMAIRLTARSVFSEPSRSSTRATGRPKRLLLDADRDQVAVLRIFGGARAGSRAPCRAASCRPARAARRRPAARGRCRCARVLALSMILMTRPSSGRRRHLGFPATRSSARSPTPATSCGRALRGVAMRIFGTGPCSSSSHSVGVAISSPSLSRPVMSASVTSGRRAGLVQLLAPGFDVALVGQLAQHALQLDAAVVLQIEGAGDLARADLAGMFVDEGKDLVLAGKRNAVWDGVSNQ